MLCIQEAEKIVFDVFTLQLKTLLQRPILHMEVTSEKLFRFLTDFFFFFLFPVNVLGYLVTHH